MVEFSLASSCYATMALREIMKQGTGTTFQVEGGASTGRLSLPARRPLYICPSLMVGSLLALPRSAAQRELNRRFEATRPEGEDSSLPAASGEQP